MPLLGFDWQPAGGGPAYDPSSEALTGYWQGDNYSNITGTWTGTASAGSSGSHDLTEATAPLRPGVGSLNGFTTVSYDGIDDKLGSASAISTFVNVAAWRARVVFKVASFTTNNAGYYQNGPLLCDDGQYWGLHIKGSGASGTIYAYVWDGAQQGASASISTGTWYVVDAWYDGTNINMNVNGSAGTPDTSGSIQTATNVLKAGARSPYFFNGEIAEALLIDSDNTGTVTPATYLAYAQARYAI